MAISAFGANRRGTYTIITTFFFILVVLAVVIGLAYYGTLFANAKKQVADQMSKYDLAKSAKDRIYNCYGRTVIKSSLVSSGDPCLTFDEIEGYRIEQFAKGTLCDARNYSFGVVRQDFQVFNYLVPIMQEDTKTTCLGRLDIYIK